MFFKHIFLFINLIAIMLFKLKRKVFKSDILFFEYKRVSSPFNNGPSI